MSAKSSWLVRGPVVWIPGNPLSEGLLLRGTPIRIPKPPAQRINSPLLTLLKGITNAFDGYWGAWPSCHILSTVNGEEKIRLSKHRQIGPEIGKTIRPRRRSLNSLILLRMDLDGRILFIMIFTRFFRAEVGLFIFFLRCFFMVQYRLNKQIAPGQCNEY